MPIDAASRSEKSIPGIAFSASAPSNVPKIPNCAAPPSKAVLGFASIGPKSVIAPIPMNISNGKIPVDMPAS